MYTVNARIWFVFVYVTVDMLKIEWMQQWDGTDQSINRYKQPEWKKNGL